MKPLIIAIIVVILGATGGCFLKDWFFPSQSEKKFAKQEDAEFLLKNMALGMRIYSVKHGGGGHKDFASSLENVKPFIMEKAYPALPGPQQTSFHGWKVRLEENPAGDRFKTNFQLVAYPAENYDGKIFCVDKSEKVSQYNKNGDIK